MPYPLPAMHSDRETRWNAVSHATYEEASKRRNPSMELANKYPSHYRTDFNPYSLDNIKHVVLSTSKLLGILVSPYACGYMWIKVLLGKASMPLSGVILMAVHYVAINQWSFYRRLAQKAGLYYADTEANKELLKKCDLITSPFAIKGCMPGVATTPWLLSGDMQTLFPFLAFRPKPTVYLRRWVRVPLDSSNAKLRSVEGDFEAVAVDWAQGRGAPVTGPKVALVILSGLTGGSREGYMLDLVNSATARGWDCFVVIGRGLASTPCHSGSVFHGARTSDFVAVAKAVRSFLPPKTTICGVGLSMGAILLCNAMCKGKTENIIDAGVSISACLDPCYNADFSHSVDLWQPFLVLGMKQNLLSTIKPFHHVISHLGENAVDILNGCSNVVDLDTHFFPAMNNFKGRDEFYANSVPATQHYEDLRIPLLAVHAADDPIVHADTHPRPGTEDEGGNSFSKKGSNSSFISLVTTTGGHVGWPVGIFPWINRWVFQNSVTLEFCEAVHKVKTKAIKK